MAGTFQDFQNITVEPYTLVDQVSSTEIYIGTSNNGNKPNDPMWRIKKISKISGKLDKIVFNQYTGSTSGNTNFFNKKLTLAEDGIAMSDELILIENLSTNNSTTFGADYIVSSSGNGDNGFIFSPNTIDSDGLSESFKINTFNVNSSTSRLSIYNGNANPVTITSNGSISLPVNATFNTNNGQINKNYQIYAVGTSYVITNTPSAITFGTTSPVLTIGGRGTFLVKSRINIKYNGSTFSSNRTVTLKLTRTNNTPGDIANSSTSIITDIVITITKTFMIVSLPDIIYTTTNNNDIITIFASIDTLPSAGSLQITEASIVATRLY